MMSSTILLEDQLGPKAGNVDHEPGSTDSSGKEALRDSKSTSLAITLLGAIALVLLVMAVAYYVYRKKQSARGANDADSASGGKTSTNSSVSTA